MALGVGDIDVNAGSGFMRGMKKGNEIIEGATENAINNIKRQWAPITVPAQAMSQLAYTNLVGPQFLAKLMGNPAAVANMSQDQREGIMNLIHNAGVNQANGNSSFSQFQQPQQPQNPFFELLSSLGKGIGNVFGYNEPSSQQQLKQPQQQQQFTGNNVSSSQQSPANNSYQGTGLDQTPQYDENGKIPIANPPGYQPKKDYFERAGEEIGKQKQGEESGKIRANDIKEFGDTYQSSLQKQDTFNEINKLISSPEFEKIRQLPAADKHELLYYKRYGTKSQQNMVGKLETLIGNVVRDTAQDFRGAFRKGEQQLVEGMKINLADTVDAARGKAETLTYLNAMLRERTKISHDLMKNQHFDKTEALESADREVNGNKIRQTIHDQINPTVTIKNRKTGETITIPASEAREKYGVG